MQVRVIMITDESIQHCPSRGGTSITLACDAENLGGMEGDREGERWATIGCEKAKSTRRNNRQQGGQEATIDGRV